MDLNWFKHSFHQIDKLTSYAIEERDLSQADRLYSVHFATHLCNCQRAQPSEDARLARRQHYRAVRITEKSRMLVR